MVCSHLDRLLSRSASDLETLRFLLITLDLFYWSLQSIFTSVFRQHVYKVFDSLLV